MFNPTPEQSLAKIKLHEFLESGSGIWTVETMPLDVMCKLVGTKKLNTWIRGAEFAAWWINRDSTKQRARALVDSALFELEDLMTNQEVAAKDRLKAIDMLLNLTGSYPKAAPPRFLDKDLESMDAQEVERQTKQLQQQLGIDKGEDV
tara:strand:+ start:114 stop:557 length:444 start_codon:yes stop_codon:yes gene_type:complete